MVFIDGHEYVRALPSMPMRALRAEVSVGFTAQRSGDE
jgi:hypothetical protein